MKKYIILLLVIVFWRVQSQTYTVIPDANFESALSAYDDIPGDHQIPTAAIDTITVLNVGGRNIADLTGIQDFTALLELDCGNNQLVTLDLSQNHNLKIVKAPTNNLTSVDVTQCPALEVLQLSQSQLTSIDVSQNPALYYLELYTNQISQIDVTNNPALVYLYLNNNQLTQLDVSQNTQLFRLHCMNNQLTQLDVSANTNLWWLDCALNQITQLDVSMLSNLHHLVAFSNQLTSLNLDQNGQLDWLRVHNNQLTELHLQNGNNNNFDPSYFDIRNNPDLHCVFVDDVTWCTQNLTNIDSQTHFVANQTECDAVDIGSFVDNHFEIYPNPAGDLLHIRIDDGVNYKIFNLQGEVLQHGKIYSDLQNIPVKGLSNGIYIFQVQGKECSENRIFIKK